MGTLRSTLQVNTAIGCKSCTAESPSVNRISRDKCVMYCTRALTRSASTEHATMMPPLLKLWGKQNKERSTNVYSESITQSLLHLNTSTSYWANMLIKLNVMVLLFPFIAIATLQAIKTLNNMHVNGRKQHICSMRHSLQYQYCFPIPAHDLYIYTALRGQILSTKNTLNPPVHPC